jgi:hypothetical protein
LQRKEVEWGEPWYPLAILKHHPSNAAHKGEGSKQVSAPSQHNSNAPLAQLQALFMLLEESKRRIYIRIDHPELQKNIGKGEILVF